MGRPYSLSIFCGDVPFKKKHPAFGDPPLLYPNYDPFTKLVN